MGKLTLQKFLIALAFFCAAGFVNIDAQTKSCGLNLEVTEAIYAEPPIQGATATATNLATKKSFKSSLFEGMPVFGEMPAGKYSLTVSKAGYKTLFKQINLDCSKIESDDPSVTEYILLRKAAGKTAAANSGIRKIDFLNYSYQPGVCAADVGLPKTVKTRAGKFKSENNFYNVAKTEIGYGDINGDGAEDAIVQIRCGSSAGTLRAFELHAFTMQINRAKLLARLDSDQIESDYRKTFADGTVFSPSENAPKIENGKLLFETLTDGSFASPENVAMFDYKLSKTKFVLETEPQRHSR